MRKKTEKLGRSLRAQKSADVPPGIAFARWLHRRVDGDRERFIGWLQPARVIDRETGQEIKLHYDE